MDLQDVDAADVLDRDAAEAQAILEQARTAAAEANAPARRRFVPEDFVAARDVGLGGHCSAREYHRQLLELPPDPHEWPDECFPAAGLILSQARHLFFLAQEARWQRPQNQEDPEYFHLHRTLQLYFAARTLVSGPVRDGEGNDVHHPIMDELDASAFEELGWPRYSEQMTEDGEVWVVQRDAPLDKGSFWDSRQTRFHCNHVFEFFWSGLLCPSDFERLEEQKQQATANLEIEPENT